MSGKAFEKRMTFPKACYRHKTALCQSFITACAGSELSLKMNVYRCFAMLSLVMSL